MLRVREKEATWGIAIIAWLCGLIASRRLSWDALIPAAGAVCYLLMLERLSLERFPAILSSHHRKRLWEGLSLSFLFTPLLGWAVSAIPSQGWVAAIVLPGLLYGAARVCSVDRFEVFAVMGLATLTSLAPATYLMISREPSTAVALTLWGFFGAYSFLSALLLRTKLSGSRAILWFARLTSIGLLLGSLLLLFLRPSVPRGLIAMVFLLTGLRVWCYRSDRPVNLTRLEAKELSYDALAALAIDAAVLLA